jgi:hypothetical protein
MNLSDENVVKQMWTDYIGNVRKGDLKAALSGWDKSDQRILEADRIFDWQTQLCLWQNKELFLSQEDSIISIKEIDDFVELTIGWKIKRISYNEKKYLQREGSRFYFITPARFYRRNYNHIKYGHFNYYYPPGKTLSPTKLKMNEQFYLKMTALLKIPKRDIDFYVVTSQKEIGDLLGSSYFGGLGMSQFGVVFSKDEFMDHETAHALLYQISHYPKSHPIHFVSEGSATSFEPPYRRLPLPRGYLKHHPEFRISTIINEDVFATKGAEKGTLDYVLSGSFIRYLIANYGIDKFKVLYSKSYSESDYLSNLIAIYGKDIETLNDEWKRDLLASNIPGLDCGFNEAKVVFSQNDAVGDDYGDGTNEYPKEGGYYKGMCDLVNLRIEEYQNNVFFELTFKDSIDVNDRKITSMILLSCSDSTSVREVGRNSNLKVSGKVDYYIMITGTFVAVYDYLYEMIFMDDLRWSNCFPLNSNVVPIGIPKVIINEEIKKINVLIGLQRGNDADSRYGPTYFRDNDTKRDSTLKVSKLYPNVYDILEPKGKTQSEILKQYDNERPVLPMVSIK